MRYLPAIEENDALTSGANINLSCKYNKIQHQQQKQMKQQQQKLQQQMAPVEKNPTISDHDRPIDNRRIFLVNFPDEIDHDYLELYLEYLSDEIEVESIENTPEDMNSLLITFKKNIGQ